MTCMQICTRIALGFALAFSLMPGFAFADTGDDEQGSLVQLGKLLAGKVDGLGQSTTVASLHSSARTSFTALVEKTVEVLEADEAAKGNKLLAYDPAAIEAIGTQEESGHTICCPSFACAYGDAVLDGTVHGHEYYTCSCCTWTDWGGGASSDRCVGSDEELLREAYDQISAGRPTVIHVSWSGGEHWITLIGYENATDPDHLTLSNFIALDPWDGAQLNAGSKYELFGDGCEHISER